MTVTTEHLKALAASLNNLAGTVDQIAKDLSEQPAPSPAPKKSAPKKKSAKKAPAKKSTKRKPTKAKAKKDAQKTTKMDVVLTTIRRARKGVDTAELMKRTGFDKRTISNSVYKLKKNNMIKSPKKGMYIKA